MDSEDKRWITLGSVGAYDGRDREWSRGIDEELEKFPDHIQTPEAHEKCLGIFFCSENYLGRSEDLDSLLLSLRGTKQSNLSTHLDRRSDLIASRLDDAVFFDF